MTLQNNLIERIWVEVNARVNYPIKAIMNEMVHTNVVDISDDSTKFCVSWVLCRVSEYGLRIFVNSWNYHTIPSTFLLICSKILIKRNPTCLFVFETRLFVLRFCSQYVIDNEVPRLTRKICFSNFKPAVTERSFDMNPTFIKYK